MDYDASIITTESCKVIVYILNSKGEQIRMMDMGVLEAGEHAIKWDGKNAKGTTVADGAYRYQVTATNPQTKEVLTEGVYPQVSGKITSVSFDSSGQPIIHMGNASLALGQVIQILEAGTLTTTPPNDGDDDDKGGQTPAPDPDPEPDPGDEDEEG